MSDDSTNLSLEFLRRKLADAEAERLTLRAPSVALKHEGGDSEMADVTREEIDAKLEAAEARTEARFAQLNGTLNVQFANLDYKIDRLANVVQQLSESVYTVKEDNKKTRTTIIIVVVASVLAGLAAIWTTQGNMLAAFQASLAVKTTQSAPPKP
jgi:hypothetical protein